MAKKFFWRRSLAYIIDILLSMIVASILVVILNSFFSTKILAPDFIRTTGCEIREDLVTQDTLNRLLPLDEGGRHQQVLCKQTNMFVTTFYVVKLYKTWQKDDTTFNANIFYYADENGQQAEYISFQPFVYLLMPFIFALFISKKGYTPGKRVMSLIVYNDAFEKIDLRSALKREYLKSILFVLSAIFSLFTMVLSTGFDIEQAANTLTSLLVMLEQINFMLVRILAIIIFVLIFVFYFGSFIRWRGQAYWDKFSKLYVSHRQDYYMRKSCKK